jgi:hypothetical protein
LPVNVPASIIPPVVNSRISSSSAFSSSPTNFTSLVAGASVEMTFCPVYVCYLGRRSQG